MLEPITNELIELNSNKAHPQAGTRVVLGIEHGLERAAYAAALAHQPDIEVLGAVGDSEGVYQLLESTDPNLLIVDSGIPPHGGVGTLTNAVAHRPDLALMMLSDRVSVTALYELTAVGRSGIGVVSRSMFKEFDDFVTATEVVASGRVLLDPRIAQLLALGKDRHPLEELTNRERSTLAAVATGMSNKAAAESLGISPRTIENHLSSILLKFGERGRPDHDGRVVAILRYLEASGKLTAA